jgi:hypothetical protein
LNELGSKRGFTLDESVQKAGCPSVCVMAEFFWPLAFATGSMHTRFENAIFAFESQLMAMSFCNEKIYTTGTNERVTCSRY